MDHVNYSFGKLQIFLKYLIKFCGNIANFLLTVSKMPECTCDYKRVEGEDNHECQLKLPVEKVLAHKINKERPVDENNPLR